MLPMISDNEASHFLISSRRRLGKMGLEIRTNLTNVLDKFTSLNNLNILECDIHEVDVSQISPTTVRVRYRKV